MSNFISGLLAARDPHVVLMALHMSAILFQKLPGIFLKYFRREGVIAEIERLANAPDEPQTPQPSPSAPLTPATPTPASTNPFAPLRQSSGAPASPAPAPAASLAPAPAPATPTPAEVQLTPKQLQKELARKCVALKKEAELNSGFRRSAGIASSEPKELIELRNHVATLSLAVSQMHTAAGMFLFCLFFFVWF